MKGGEGEERQQEDEGGEMMRKTREGKTKRGSRDKTKR